MIISILLNLAQKQPQYILRSACLDYLVSMREPLRYVIMDKSKAMGDVTILTTAGTKLQGQQL